MNHALLGPSSSYKWLNCPLSAKLEYETEESPPSKYAGEGTLAHSICEAYANKKFKKMATRAFNKAIKEAKSSELYTPEMLKHAESYVELLGQIVLNYETMPYIQLEQKVDISEYVPESFGTVDCLIIGGETLTIVDIKYGQGVKVSAEYNPQLMLYALGVLNRYSPLYGQNIKQISIYIFQPRLDNTSCFNITTEDLLSWGENEVKPKAQKAFMGFGECIPGEWCDKGFCKIRANCKNLVTISTLYSIIKL